jgi:hypothetical protein
MYNYTIMQLTMTLELIVLLGAAAGALGYLITKIVKGFNTWFQFVNDWYGKGDIPGVTERLQMGSDRFDYIEKELKVIKDELFNNSGSSLRDAIDRIEAAVAKPDNSSSPKN